MVLNVCRDEQKVKQLKDMKNVDIRNKIKGQRVMQKMNAQEVQAMNPPTK